MATSIWGLLKESLTSSKLIREAIADMIADHDNDPTAHLGETGSLESHKASEIIDHEVNSIINDKIAPNQITPNQLSFGNAVTVVGINSLTPFTVVKTGSGSDVVIAGYNDVALLAGTSVNNRAYLSLQAAFSALYSADNPILEFIIPDPSLNNAEIYATIGIGNPWQANVPAVGFRIDCHAAKTYAYYTYSVAGVYSTVTFDLGGLVYFGQLFRIEIDDTAKTIKFYIGGVLKETVDYTGKTLFSDEPYLFSFGINRTYTGGSAVECDIFNPFFTKLHSFEM